MQVRDVMTPLRDCFMLASNLRLNFQTMLAIYKSGALRRMVFVQPAVLCTFCAFSTWLGHRDLQFCAGKICAGVWSEI